MKKSFPYLILLLLFPISLFSQTCLPEGLIFTTQEEIDYFPADYPNCTEVSGRIIIQGEDITNLDSLYPIVSIAQRLMIYKCPNIVSITGLSNLNSLDTLLISHSESLKTLVGLEGVTSLTYLSIGMMESLSNLNGLDNLTKIHYRFRLLYNNNLTDISALNNIYILNHIYVGYNPRLKTLNLQSVLYSDSGIDIGDNDSLTDVNFDNLTYSRYVYLYRNALLAQISFPNLLEINGDLAIYRNDQLLSLGDFNKLEMAEELYIKENAKLEDLNALNSELNITKHINIKENHSLKNIIGLNGSTQAISVNIINNANLETINGLENLTEIEENIEISDNEYLSDIIGFSSLENIKGSLIFSYNKNMTHINGFGELEYIRGDLVIDNCVKLTALPSFGKLEEIGRDFMINNNDQLLDFSGLGNLNTIGGNLEIKNHSSLISMQGMNQLSSINDNLMIENNTNTSLIGFESLEKVESTCNIKNNPNLTSLMGLKSLSFIGWGFGLDNCDEVSDLKGLENLTNSMKALFITNNEKLVNFDGLGSLKEVTYLCHITSNKNLKSLVGLNNLEKVRELYINRNNSLEDLSGLERLVFVEDFTISDCPSIKNLKGIGNLNEIEYKLRISNNICLNSLAGLDNAILPQELLIYDNPLLAICNTDCICHFLSENPDAELTINNNAVGCDNANEILEACENSGVFEPIVFPDWTAGPQWNVLELSTALPNVAKTYTYSYETDTLFCGKKYSRTYLHDIDRSIYVRSTNKRSYYRLSKNCEDKEYMLYNYDLNIGDTAWVGWEQYRETSLDTAAFILSSIDTIQQYGVERERYKMIYAEDDELFEGSFNWMKGVGSQTHPFYPFAKLHTDSLYDYSLLCYDSLGVQLYQDPWWNTCDTNYISIDKIKEGEFVISPNPFSHKLKITAAYENIQSVRLYSITGKLIQEKAMLNSKTVIFHINPTVPQGIYLLKVFTDSKMLQKKVLKL